MIWAILVEGHLKNVPVKLFQIHPLVKEKKSFNFLF